MPNGPANNSPTCQRCGLYLRVHGCSVERCANPVDSAELERIRAEVAAKGLDQVLVDALLWAATKAGLTTDGVEAAIQRDWEMQARFEAERCANPNAPVTIAVPVRAPTAIDIVRTHLDGSQTVTTVPFVPRGYVPIASATHDVAAALGLVKAAAPEIAKVLNESVSIFDEHAPPLPLDGRHVPPGYVSRVSTGAAVQAARVCGCVRCEADGQHEPMCGVHGDGDEVGPCSCGKGTR